MPIECALLDQKPELLEYCPACTAYPFRCFMRGMVQRSKRRWWVGKRQPYCAVICSHCKTIVSWEQLNANVRLRVPQRPQA